MGQGSESCGREGGGSGQLDALRCLFCPEDLPYKTGRRRSLGSQVAQLHWAWHVLGIPDTPGNPFPKYFLSLPERSWKIKGMFISPWSYGVGGAS